MKVWYRNKKRKGPYRPSRSHMIYPVGLWEARPDIQMPVAFPPREFRCTIETVRAIERRGAIQFK